MSNPLIVEESFWSGRRLVGAAAITLTLVTAGVFAGGETVLILALGSIAPLVCLWAPHAVASFPLAGVLFGGRLLSHSSSEESVVIIGWLLLVGWMAYSMFEVFG